MSYPFDGQGSTCRRHHHCVCSVWLPAAALTSAGNELSAVEEDREELMESILEDEEEIIAVHRAQIEETMEIVRK